MQEIRHVLGISGGKDSAALAIYMKRLYPDFNIEYYTSDTGKELEETYQLIQRLEGFLGVRIKQIGAAENSHINPFDHFLKLSGNYLPSSTARWCTQKLKLEPFERYVGTVPTVSYVGIRGDEDREGYISQKTNIQSIFPFRKNIWSADVIAKALHNANLPTIVSLYDTIVDSPKKARMLEIAKEPLSMRFNRTQKLESLLNLDVKAFNHVIFAFLKTTEYPLAKETYFPLIENEEVLIREDIFRILRESGVGIPAYYEEKPFEVNGQAGTYFRSRSGCFFCFYQQKIEWVWLYEQHPDKFKEAMQYEKDGYTWMQGESLSELIQPERIEKIKAEYLLRLERNKSRQKSGLLMDILDVSETEGCASCFI